MDSETPTPNRVRVQWPDRSQIIRQSTVLGIAIVCWSTLFWGAMTIPGSFDQGDSAAERRRAAAVPVPATDTVAPVEVADESGDEPAEEAPTVAETPPAETPEVVAEQTPAVTPPPAADPEPEPTPAEPTPTVEEPTEVATAPEEETPPPTSTTADSDAAVDDVLLDPLAGAADEELGEVSFASDILPIMENRCIKCHGGLRDDGTQRIEEGLNLMTVDHILAGSTWGSVVEPGDVAGSYLYEVVENGDMPDNEPRLLPRELRLIAAWIRQGAPAN